MKRLSPTRSGLCLAATLVAAASAGELADFQEKLARVLERASPAVVKVKSANTYGSGVIVSPDGLVLTNRRVVTQDVGSSPTVILPDGSSAPARIVKIDVVHDLALLKVERTDLPSLPVASEDPAPGTWVAVIGKAFFKDSDDLAQTVKLAIADSNTVTMGTVNGRDRLDDPDGRHVYKGEALLIDALVNPGCEGGAVIDTAGRLVGIVAQLQTDGRTWDEVDFAVPASALTRLLEGVPAAAPSPSGEDPGWPDLAAEFRGAAAGVLPSLVRVRTEWTRSTIIKMPDESGPGPFTGVILDAEGRIVASGAHFPESRTLSKLTVEYADGARVPARLVGRDRRTDLVLLAAEAPGGTPASFAPETETHVGQLAVSVSASFEPAGTPALHAGIVSALDRQQGALQTDASLLLANRGGPLVDRQGRILGIMTQLQRQQELEMEQKNGVAFAIPYSRLAASIDRMKKGETLSFPFVGVGFPPPPGQNEAGCLVTTVEPGSPAAKAGLREADVILAFDGHRILNAEQFRKRLFVHAPGEKVTLKVERIEKRKSVTVDLPVTLVAIPDKR